MPPLRDGWLRFKCHHFKGTGTLVLVCVGRARAIAAKVLDGGASTGLAATNGSRAVDAMAVLRAFKEGSNMEFILSGTDPNPAATYDYYRCDCIWRDLHDWLRSKGVRQKKAIHALRKESGSLIASNFGIEAARQHLGTGTFGRPRLITWKRKNGSKSASR